MPKIKARTLPDGRRRYSFRVDTGRGPDGKRIRRKVGGRTRQDVKDKLEKLHEDLKAGIRAPDGRYTVGQAGEDWRIDVMLAEIGVAPEMAQQRFGDLSGGWQRLMLIAAAARLEAPDILILDEPTNHLDIGHINTLEGWLTGETRLPLLVVSHDREFLNRVTTRTLFLRADGAHAFKAPFALAREQGHAERLRLSQIRRQFGKHRYAPRDVETADHQRHAFRPEGAREVERAGKLVRLNSNEPDEPLAVSLYSSGHRLDVDELVTLVIGFDLDLDVGTKRLLLGASG